uniref:Uncharacterized protein n=1 Tax=Fagus sylvatica TaxID=28930 RepID=A0A2N9FC39_FAGSY
MIEGGAVGLELGCAVMVGLWVCRVCWVCGFTVCEFAGHETPTTPNPCSPASPLHRSASSPTPLHLQQPHHHRCRHISTRSASPLLHRSLLQFTRIHRQETPLCDPPPRLSASSRGSLPPRQPPFQTLLSPPRQRTQRLYAREATRMALVDWSRAGRLGAAHGCLGWLSMEALRGSHGFETFSVLWLSWLSRVETLSVV